MFYQVIDSEIDKLLNMVGIIQSTIPFHINVTRSDANGSLSMFTKYEEYSPFKMLDTGMKYLEIDLIEYYFTILTAHTRRLRDHPNF